MFLLKARKFKHDDARLPVIYEQILKAARAPVFYAQWGVPDTVEGRYQMMLLHLNIILIALKDKGEEAKSFSQSLFDYFFKEIERSYRENGASDYNIGHKMKRAIAYFYGSAFIYEKALAKCDASVLKASLRRNLYVKVNPSEAQLDEVSAYVESQMAELMPLSFEQFKKRKNIFALKPIKI